MFSYGTKQYWQFQIDKYQAILDSLQNTLNTAGAASLEHLYTISVVYKESFEDLLNAKKQLVECEKEA